MFSWFFNSRRWRSASFCSNGPGWGLKPKLEDACIISSAHGVEAYHWAVDSGVKIKLAVRVRGWGESFAPELKTLVPPPPWVQWSHDVSRKFPAKYGCQRT
jgi:hypothetical protein